MNPYVSLVCAMCWSFTATLWVRFLFIFAFKSLRGKVICAVVAVMSAGIAAMYWYFVLSNPCLACIN